MDQKAEVREFLTSRRAKITPEQAGLQHFGGKRRVPGLRREEVAMLAGVSADYYTRVEKGNLSGVSESVLEAIANALQLDEAERAHLSDLARTANTNNPPAPRRRAQHVRLSTQLLLDSMQLAPAFVRSGRLDIVASNALGRALYAPVFDDHRDVPNLARFCFFDERALNFYPDWNEAANTTVAILRTEAGKDPYDKSLSDLIGELATRSEAFRTRWAAHNVRLHRTGKKRFIHPEVGELDLMFDAMDLPADTGLTFTAYTAEPGSPAEERLRLLASWVATSSEYGLR